MTKPAAVLGIDASPTACKASAWDPTGISRAEGRSEYELCHPEADGWEQNADDWWVATTAAMRTAVAALEGNFEVVAICIAHQRETFVLTDELGKPLSPALVWMDARCRKQVVAA